MAGAGISVKIEGMDDCMRMFDNFPDNMISIEKKAMRDASKVVSKYIRSRTPKRFRKLVKFKLYEDRTRANYVLIGFYNRKEVAGNQPEEGDPVFDWFKAYWANYGTLKRRDPNHKFKYPIKAKTKSNNRRQSVGQPAINFFNKAVDGWEDIYMNTFEASVKSNEDMLYNR